MESKEFRGESGEVVRGFLSFGTWLTAVPVGIATVILALGMAFVQERLGLPAVVAVPAYLVALAPLTGLFALAGRAGQQEAGFLEALAGQSANLPGFCLRYGALTLAWSVPLVLAFQKAAGAIPSLVLEGPGPKLTGAVWTAVALVAASLVAPTVSLLVATRADTLSEAFSGAAWRWVFSERRADLVPFVASAVGGLTLFLLAALPPLALLLPMAADVSARVAQAAVLALPMLPAATAPILVGRLAGAFVGAEPLPGSEPARAPSRPARPAHAGTPHAGSASPAHAAPAVHDDAAAHAAGRTHAGLAGIPPAVRAVSSLDCPTSVEPARDGGARGVPLGVAVARAHQLATTDLPGALAELEALRAANPRNPAVVAELARVLRMASRDEEARQAAASAIRLALSGGAGPIAHDVFRSFAHEAVHLNLEPAVYEQLGRILSARREFDGASWCYRAAAALGGDPRALQKGLLSVAEMALETGEPERAASVFEAFARTWPDSPLAAFARDGAASALRKAGVK